jgi:hypothetical protein
LSIIRKTLRRRLIKVRCGREVNARMAVRDACDADRRRTPPVAEQVGVIGATTKVAGRAATV